MLLLGCVFPRSMTLDGESFADEYVLQHQLGDGGTASVWSATHRQSGAIVAAKLTSRQQGMRWSRAVRTFEHEAAMLKKCQHEHVVSCFALFQGPRDLALTLELLPGGDMQQLLQRHGALAEHAVAAIIRQLATALVHVHKCGVLHRDVKLENLLVVRPGASPAIKLCDFGHAATFEAKDDGFTGTMGYAAPEVTGLNNIAPRWSAAADAWSTGVVMYACLANTPLQWAGDGPDFSPRPLAKSSTTAKLLIRSLLAIKPTERSSLDRACTLLAEKPDGEGGVAARGMGLRRGLGNAAHSYSLLDMSTLDKEHVPRADLVLSNTPSGTSGLLSPSTSHDSLSRGLSPVSQRANGSFSNLLPNAAAAAPSATALPPPAVSHSEAARSSALAAVMDAELLLPPPPALPGPAYLCIKDSWMRGRYERTLHIDEANRRVVTVEPRTGRVTNEWPFARILAVVEDDERLRFPARPSTASAHAGPADAAAASAADAAPASASRQATLQRGFSLLVEGSAPQLLCLNGWVTPRLRFTAPTAVCGALVSRLRSLLLVGHAVSPPADSSQPAATVEARRPTPPILSPTPLQTEALSPRATVPLASLGSAERPWEKPRPVAIPPAEERAVGAGIRGTGGGGTPPSPLGPQGVLKHMSAGGISPPSAFRGRAASMSHAMSSNNLDRYAEFNSSEAAQSSREQNAQEDQLRRMRERMLAIKSGSGSSRQAPSPRSLQLGGAS